MLRRQHFEHAATFCASIYLSTDEAFQTLCVAAGLDNLFNEFGPNYDRDRFFDTVATRSGFESLHALQCAAADERATAAQSLYLAEQIATGEETDSANLLTIALSAVNPNEKG